MNPNDFGIPTGTDVFEEIAKSEQQIKMRADRIGINSENFYILTETNTQTVFQEIQLFSNSNLHLVVSLHW